MSEIITKLVIDCSTGIETIVPLTAEELAQREIDAQAAIEAQAAKESAEAEAAAIKASALAKLSALGLTEAEAQSIIG